jgi:UDPglucose 6-dehydrogenase
LRNTKEGRIVFTTNLEEVLEASEIIFLALPTSPGADGSADLKYVLGLANQLGKLMTGYKVILNKSTVPVGTGDKVSVAIAKNYSGEYDLVRNPEFLR